MDLWTDLNDYEPNLHLKSSLLFTLNNTLLSSGTGHSCTKLFDKDLSCWGWN